MAELRQQIVGGSSAFGGKGAPRENPGLLGVGVAVGGCHQLQDAGERVVKSEVLYGFAHAARGALRGTTQLEIIVADGSAGRKELELGVTERERDGALHEVAEFSGQLAVV